MYWLKGDSFRILFPTHGVHTIEDTEKNLCHVKLFTSKESLHCVEYFADSHTLQLKNAEKYCLEAFLFFVVKRGEHGKTLLLRTVLRFVSINGHV